ncbi:MAG: hypothetical protein AMJ65_14525 [Phycisphaerae bacterium SG8_4]|nr:MAG: hypothetical protein AMJ65_14525 [Phycisphaerae bacterium SG8_4]
MKNTVKISIDGVGAFGEEGRSIDLLPDDMNENNVVVRLFDTSKEGPAKTIAISIPAEYLRDAVECLSRMKYATSQISF